MRRSSRRITVGYATPQPDIEPHCPEYAELRAAAEAVVRSHGGFVDPVALRRVDGVISRRGRDWGIAVLGYAWHSGRSYTDLQMLLIADERDATPPLPEHVARQRAEAQAESDAWNRAYKARQEALAAEWDAIVKAMPVPVGAVHNYESHRHYENYVQGGDHIVVREDLHHGRLHRKAYLSLCWTPSYAHNLDLAFARDPQHDNAWPTCKKCIRTACRITGLQAPTLLSQR